jgi:hypothetical protein
MSERRPFLSPGPRAVLLRAVGAISIDDLHGLDSAVLALRDEKRRDVDKGFVFAWWEGPPLATEDEEELNDLFADVVTALATGLTGLDVERVAARFAQKPSVLDGIARLFLPPRAKRRLQDASIGLIEDAVAPWDPRLAIVATWNMACAAALREHLSAATVEKLEAAWRRALGDVPA